VEPTAVFALQSARNGSCLPCTILFLDDSGVLFIIGQEAPMAQLA
jgi:hypothetical protein